MPFPAQDCCKYIPLRIYGDGAEAQQPFEIYTLLSVLHEGSSTMDSRLLISCRNCHQTTDRARTDILETIAWSFEALGSLAATFMKLKL